MNNNEKLIEIDDEDEMAMLHKTEKNEMSVINEVESSKFDKKNKVSIWEVG